MESHGNGVVDFGRFLTGFFVVMGIGMLSQPVGCAGFDWHATVYERTAGRRVNYTEQQADYDIALPTLLWHSAQIAGGAAAMSVFGGLLIYATIISFTLFFQEQEDF